MLRVGHGSDVYGGILAKGRIEGGRRGLRDGEKMLEVDRKEWTGV